MPGYLLDVTSTLMCPHAGQVSAVTSNTRVTLGGQPAVAAPGTFTIAGLLVHHSWNRSPPMRPSKMDSASHPRED